jgi:uncharacterized hydrophobic protein (TIGR00271 family)
VLVPVANPTTAWHLLRLGAALADPDGGEVIALNVVINGAQDALGNRDRTGLEELVERLKLAGMPVRWHSVSATSAARGILDAAREENANLIVLGYQGSTNDGDPVLGSVVEAVARTTPSDLVVYRGDADADVQRILLPANGSINAKVAARLAVLLADVYRVPITALYVMSPYERNQWIGQARIGATLNGLPGAEAVERRIVQEYNTATGILSNATARDLVLLGFSEQSQFDKWLYGNVPQRILRDAPGPVILTKDAMTERAPVQVRTRRWLSGLTPRLTPGEVADLRQQASDMARPSINFFVLVILSSLIASFGLMQNSPAVIIGAMLVAPLMSPLLAFAAGLVTGELRMMQSAVINMTKGVIWALVMAIVVGVLFPAAALTLEITSRTRPGLLDMAVALASGAAAAYATARKDVPAALAGVAIAAALMPPLCAVGIAAAFGEWEASGGALLLFATNIVSISLAGAVVFRWLGLRPVGGKAGRPLRQRLAILALVLVVMALPLSFGLIRIAAQQNDAQTVTRVLEDAWSDIGGLTLVDVQIDHEQEDTLLVKVTIHATADAIIELTAEHVGEVENQISDELGKPATLEVAVVQIIQAAPP